MKTIIIAELKAGKALIRITDVIHSELETGSTNVRSQVDGFIRDGVKSADVYINSVGGSVFETVEIVNQLKRFDDVSVSVGAMAASAATYITSSFNTVCKPDSKFMIHKPRMVSVGNEDEIESALKLLKDTTADYYTIYATKTGKSFDQIKLILSKGDVWMTAQEALKEGFVNAIEDSIQPAEEKLKPQTETEKQRNFAALHLNSEKDILVEMGGKPGWTLHDYLVNDVEAYYLMRAKFPQTAEKLENLHLNSAASFISDFSHLNTEKDLLTAMGGKPGWTLKDYSEKDIDAYYLLAEKHPKLHDLLIDKTVNTG